MRSLLWRRAALIGGIGVCVSLAAAPGAAAAPCMLTSAMRDGHFLTAELMNPSTVTGTVDASGCDIGVYNNAGHTTISNATIENAKYYGVLTEGSVASTDVSNSIVQDIGDAPFSGAQHGMGVEWASGSTGSVDRSTIRRYQKNGVVVDGSNTHASVTNDTIMGLGPVPFIAQNGVQISDGATATVSGNTITDNDYTGCSNQDAAKTGCIPFVSTGLLLYNVDPSQVNRFKNFYRNDQRNEVVYPAAEVSAQS